MQCRGNLQQVKLFWTVRKGDYESQPSKHNLIQTDPVPLQDIREVRNVWDLGVTGHPNPQTASATLPISGTEDFLRLEFLREGLTFLNLAVQESM